MAYDIRLSTGYFDHHKILKLRQKHGADAVMAHTRLLFYAREHRADGAFYDMDFDDICLIIRNEITDVNERQNVINSLINLKLLDKDSNGTISIHDWEDHNQYAVDSTEKGDINRFSRLKAIFPKKHKELSDKGITKITKADYEAIKRTLTNVKESSNETLTPNPTQPNPTQLKNDADVSFVDFWNNYHLLVGKLKTDKDSALKYWKKLNKTEKQAAFDNIEPYSRTRKPTDIQGEFMKKAYTYLRDKTFNDEFKIINNEASPQIDDEVQQLIRQFDEEELNT